MTFSTQTIVTIEQLVFPLLKTLTGVDAQAFAGEQAEKFTVIGDSLADLAGLFSLAGSALADGLLTVEELDALVTKAKTLPEALDAIIALFHDETPTQ
jgi:hypothetical protein